MEAEIRNQGSLALSHSVSISSLPPPPPPTSPSAASQTVKETEQVMVLHLGLALPSLKKGLTYSDFMDYARLDSRHRKPWAQKEVIHTRALKCHKITIHP